MVETACSNCGNKKSFNEDKLGKKFKCPNCGNIVSIEITNEKFLDKPDVNKNNESPSLNESEDNNYSPQQKIHTSQPQVLKKPSIAIGEFINKKKWMLIIISIILIGGVGTVTIFLQNYFGINPEIEGRNAAQAWFICKGQLNSELINIDKTFIESFNSKNFKTAGEAVNWKNEIESPIYKNNKDCENNANKIQVGIMGIRENNGKITFKYNRDYPS